MRVVLVFQDLAQIPGILIEKSTRGADPFVLKSAPSTRVEITIENKGWCVKCIMGRPDEHKRLHEQGEREAPRLLTPVFGGVVLQHRNTGSTANLYNNEKVHSGSHAPHR